MTTAVGTDTLLGRLAERWSAVGFADLPAEGGWVGAARGAWREGRGCAGAGAREPLARLLRDELPTLGQATVVGSRRGADARGAALANGAAGHALDFDDTHALMPGHPTAPV